MASPASTPSSSLTTRRCGPGSRPRWRRGVSTQSPGCLVGMPELYTSTGLHGSEIELRVIFALVTTQSEEQSRIRSAIRRALSSVLCDVVSMTATGGPSTSIPLASMWAHYCSTTPLSNAIVLSSLKGRSIQWPAGDQGSMRSLSTEVVSGRCNVHWSTAATLASSTPASTWTTPGGRPIVRSRRPYVTVSWRDSPGHGPGVRTSTRSARKGVRRFLPRHDRTT